MDEFQTDLMSQMFVFPVSKNVEYLPEFRAVSIDLEEPVWMNPAIISQNRDRWIQEWDETVLR
jgi:thiamine transport system substrate-binding protein